MEFFRFKRDIPFMRYGRLTTAISLLTFILAIAALVSKGLNFGVDFTGGTVMELRLSQPLDLEKLRQQLHQQGIKELSIRQFGDARSIGVELPLKAAANSQEKVQQVIRAADAKATVVRVDFVGAQVGKELATGGLVAVFFVSIGIMAYLALRFEWRFAVSAIVANFHDVAIILGFFAFFQWEFSLPVLAAILTVLGYSVNESVVVFDRVRENFRSMRKATPAEVIDSAITSTMSRTIITHSSTQLAVLAMLFFGGEVLHNFALALTIGIVFGIYSSVLVASPIALWLGVSSQHFIQRVEKKEEAVV